MATTAAPYGLKPVKRADGMAYAGATSQYLIDPAGEGNKPFLRSSRSYRCRWLHRTINCNRCRRHNQRVPNRYNLNWFAWCVCRL